MYELKSIKSLRPCFMISFLFFIITIIISMNGVVGNDDLLHKDLIKKTDFKYYLTALEKAVDFCMRRKLYVDVNLRFGLLLVDVNLKQVLQEKRTSISAKTRLRLEQLFVKNGALADYFHYMVHNYIDVNKIGSNKKYIMALLFHNSTMWPKALDKFNTELLKQTKIYSPKQLKNIYGKWDNYYSNVYDYKKLKPSPKGWEECMTVIITRTPSRSNQRSQYYCRTTPRCKQVMREGSEFGYGLAHRILFMVIARYYRECTVFSEKVDKYMTDKYCMRSFNEAHYIAFNNFRLPDLMYEQIAICGLLGHAQFFGNYWIKSLLQFQTSEGCFSEKKIATGEFNENQMKEAEDDEWEFLRSKTIMNDQCDGHFTAVAAATLSSALRFIIETYY